VVGGSLDFQFLRDRFGLMYLGFATFGWGPDLLRSLRRPRDPMIAIPPLSSPQS